VFILITEFCVTDHTFTASHSILQIFPVAIYAFLYKYLIISRKWTEWLIVRAAGVSSIWHNFQTSPSTLMTCLLLAWQNWLILGQHHILSPKPSPARLSIKIWCFNLFVFSFSSLALSSYRAISFVFKYFSAILFVLGKSLIVLQYN
jgi:hypothetical protein